MIWYTILYLLGVPAKKKKNIKRKRKENKEHKKEEEEITKRKRNKKKNNIRNKKENLLGVPAELFALAPAAALLASWLLVLRGI